jgi:gas vesicle protein
MSHDTKDTALAFLLGVVAGGVTALLLAPDRGTETRRRIREGARDVYRRSGDRITEAKGSLGERAHDLAGSARSRVDHLTQVAKSQASAVREAVAEGKEAYRREVSRPEGE